MYFGEPSGHKFRIKFNLIIAENKLKNKGKKYNKTQ